MKACLVGFICLLLCTGCWDMKEINQLAIVSTGGADLDPQTGKSIAYYQVINPTGATSSQHGSSKAAVYTYKIEESSPGRMTEKTTTSMPRILFGAHTQSYIISERLAKNGLVDFINYLELNPERRTNVYLFVTDSPIVDVMNSFTPLERLPGNYLRSLMSQHQRSFGSNIVRTRLKDVIEGMSRHEPTIVPIIHLRGLKPASHTDLLEEIDGTKQSLYITDGAVFLQGKLVGRIDRELKKVSFVLSSKATRIVVSIFIGDARIDLEARNFHVKRQHNPQENQVSMMINADLFILNNELKTEMSEENLHEIEQSFNEQFNKAAQSVVTFAKEKNWDLLGFQDRGLADESWIKTNVLFHTSSKVVSSGNISRPYIPSEE